MANLRRLLGYLRPHAALAILVVMIMFVASLLEISPAMLVRRVLDQALPKKDMGLVVTLCLWYIGVYALRGLTNYVQWYTSELMGQKVIYDLRRAIHNHLQTLPPSYFSGMGTGQVMSRLTSDVESIQNFIGFGALLLVNMVIMFFIVATYLALLYETDPTPITAIDKLKQAIK